MEIIGFLIFLQVVAKILRFFLKKTAIFLFCLETEKAQTLDLEATKISLEAQLQVGSPSKHLPLQLRFLSIRKRFDEPPSTGNERVL